MSYATIVTTLRAAGCVFAEDEAELLLATATTPAQLAAMVERRVEGHPLEHVLGWAGFCGLKITVTTGVFVPRRRTEFLAEQAAALLRPDGVALDLCCGAGAVAAVLAATVPTAELHAADLDRTATDCARSNLPATATVYQGDLYTPLPASLRGRITVLVANAPYVPTDAIPFLPSEARDHEPHFTLDGGTDGLAIQRRVIAEAPHWLAPGGHLLIETSTHQAPATAAAMTAHGLTPAIRSSDNHDATVVIATHPA
ncbi:release factor glutamine methyltransferase [Kitasatospora gansuensis]|uniref:peptide chain release factor N(5)-glutamine methyltransferase n=1 Tax=Kitasatospora gansuensis TaxID=258050 RepID=A0A7W7SDC1_9ACTN|nr:putative protein N(5)-glutamine methyltransferase [Kitasatospora gansuensis]MBB4948378.1 release factor glutamine methyltransferase [Kitasatospora gansuensis]